MLVPNPEQYRVNLSMNQQRIDDFSAIVNSNISLDFHVTRVAVDFDNADVRAKRKSEILGFKEMRRR